MNIIAIRLTDHDLYHLDPNLPLWDDVQDLYSTDPTQETYTRSCRFMRFPLGSMSYIINLRLRLGSMSYIIQIMNISALKDLDDEL